MKIAVLSDTHMEAPTKWFERIYERYLEEADALLHCGDITGPAMYNYLLMHPAPYIVAGNMDYALGSQNIPSKLSLRLGGLTIGLTHGWSPKQDLAGRVLDSFGPGYDLVCFGHTHRREFQKMGDAAVLNPGSVRDGSMALVDVADDKVFSVSFVDLDQSA